MHLCVKFTQNIFTPECKATEKKKDPRMGKMGLHTWKLKTYMFIIISFFHIVLI